MKRKTITASQDDILVYWNQEFGSSYPLTKRLFQEKSWIPKNLLMTAPILFIIKKNTSGVWF